LAEKFVPLGEKIFVKRGRRRGVPRKKSLFYRY